LDTAIYSMYFADYYSQADFIAIDLGCQNSQQKLDFTNNWRLNTFRETVSTSLNT